MKKLAVLMLLFAAACAPAGGKGARGNAFQVISAGDLDPSTRLEWSSAYRVAGYNQVFMNHSLDRTAATNVVMYCYNGETKAEAESKTYQFVRPNHNGTTGTTGHAPLLMAYSNIVSDIGWLWRFNTSGANWLFCEYTSAGATADTLDLSMAFGYGDYDMYQ